MKNFQFAGFAAPLLTFEQFAERDPGRFDDAAQARTAYVAYFVAASTEREALVVSLGLPATVAARVMPPARPGTVIWRRPTDD